MKTSSEVLNHYNAWANRPWVRARKKSGAQAKRLGLSHAKIHGLWSLPGYRDEYAKAARQMIALSLRMERFANKNAKGE